MNRRDILKGAVAGAGALSTPVAAQHAGHAQQASEAGKAAPWKPLLFDPHQAATVDHLSELIIPATDTPGAKAARVIEYIDLLLHDGPAPRRNAFLSGLAWLDGYAIRRHSKPFVRCSANEQVAMLKSFDGAQDAELRPGGAFFEEIKALTVAGYYTSKIGIDELNKGGRVPTSFGCKHQGKHA